MTKPKSEPFACSFRIYYEDTDAGGIVYHANYLKFAERGRTESLRAAGWDHHRVAQEFGLAFIVRHAEVDYRAPAKHDDWIEVRTAVDSVGNTSLTMKQGIWRGDKLLADIKIVLVAVNLEGKPVRFPPQLRQIFSLADSP